MDQRPAPRPPTRILIIGNHTCGNRGDAAILRGLIAAIERLEPEAEITATSRFPTSSSHLLGRRLAPDVMGDWPRELRAPSHRLRRLISERLTPVLLALSARPGTGWLQRLLSGPVKRRIAALAQYDLVVQVGGSFFVDLYGARQYDTPLAAILAGRRLMLIGHSMGPFEGRVARLLARTLLQRAEAVVLRERVSRRLIEQGGLPTAAVRDGSDTAWLVDPPPDDGGAAGRLSVLAGGRPLVAITVRDLAPFDRRLGVTQDAFEAAFARLCDRLIGLGYDVVALSTCTGIEQYRDDRMPALRIRERLASPARFHVITDEVNDIEVGALLAACQLLVGTRLHSAIIAMNFGTPAIALNYEHKSQGILEAMGLGDLASPLAGLLDGKLELQVKAMLDDIDAQRSRVAEAVAAEKQRAWAMVQACLDPALGRVGPSTEAGR